MDFKMKKRSFAIVMGVCLVFLAIGAFCLTQQFSFIEGAASIGTLVPWGFYITLFLIFEAIGAGALIFAAFGKLDVASCEKLIIIGVVCSGCGGLSIMCDIGNPLQSWRMFFAPNAASPLMLDIWLMCATMLLGLLYFIGLRAEKPGLEKFGRYATGIVAALFLMGTAVMFTSMQGKLGWDSSSELAIALIQGITAGASLVILLVSSLSEEKVQRIGRITAVLLLVNLFIFFGEALLTYYRYDFAQYSFEGIMFGRYAGMFWTQVVFGIVVPGIMFFTNKQPKIASVLVLAGLVITKFLFVMRGSLYPTYAQMGSGIYIPFLEPAEGPQMITTYMPTGIEWGAGLGVVALAVALIVLCINTKLVHANVAAKGVTVEETVDKAAEAAA